MARPSLRLLAITLLAAAASAQSPAPAGILAAETPWATDYFVVHGRDAGPTVLILGGVHGNEPAGARAAQQIRHWQLTAGRLIVLPRANVLALRAQRRRTPDLPKAQGDLNRCFPVKAGDEPIGALATAIWELVQREKPDWILDLHEGRDFNQIDPKSVGSTVLTSRVGDCPERAARMLVVLNEGIARKSRKFVLKFSQVDGSLTNSAATLLGIPTLIIETTYRDQPISRRARQHRILVNAFLERLDMVRDQAHVTTGTASAEVTWHDPAGRSLIASDAVVEKLGGGMKFVEGPVWLPDEQALVFSDIPRGKLMRWTTQAGVVEWRDCANANGNTLDRKGRLLSCQHGARNVVRYEPGAEGAPTVLVDRHDSGRFHSPNDLAVRKDGTIWFTDPTYGLAGREREQEGNFVYRFDPSTGATAIVQRDFDMPNGICFAPDHERLYIADSGKKQRVGAFRVTAEGTLSPPLFWLEGGADGMRCDARGNLYTTARDGLRVYDPSGRHLVTVVFPEQPANCAFGGSEGRTLFVTARTSLYRIEVQIPGAPLARE